MGASSLIAMRPRYERGAQRRLKIAARPLRIVSRRPDEPVARPRLGLQVVRAELAAELRNVDVQVIRLVAVRGPPHLAQDRAVREQLAGVAGEQAQDAVL